MADRLSTLRVFFTSLTILFVLFFFMGWLHPFIATAETDGGEAEVIPWSGWWWPYTHGGLSTGMGYRGHPAPLEKYELLINGYYPGLITIWDKEHHFDPDAPGWYGLCPARSAASVFEHIAFYPSIHQNILFRVGDKKGLLTAAHTKDLRQWGGGDPETFHLWLLTYIKEEKTAFAADLDPSEEKWFFPIYRYEMFLQKDLFTVHVSCQIWYSDISEPDFAGNKEKNWIYTYDLYLDGEGNIVDGRWTEASVYDHPNLLFLPLAPSADNPYLTDYGKIREIAAAKDDELESDQPAFIGPGDYTLTLLNRDSYCLVTSPGDTVWFNIEKLDDLLQPLLVSLKDDDGLPVDSWLVEENMHADFTAASPSYLIEITRPDYLDPGIYQLTLDTKTPYRYVFPYIRQGGAWQGFVLSNPSSETATAVYVAGYKQDGTPLRSFGGPKSLTPGEKQSFFLSGVTWFSEMTNLDFIKILSDQPLEVFNLYGNRDRDLSGFYPENLSPVHQLIIPQLDGNTYWGFYNGEQQETEVILQHYADSGHMTEQIEITLPAGAIVRYTPSYQPFQQTGGWVMAKVSDKEVSGYAQWGKDNFQKAESMPALKDSHTSFFIPHIAFSSLWETGCSFINLSGNQNRVTINLLSGIGQKTALLTLNPWEKITMTATDIFPQVFEEELNGSALSLESSFPMNGCFYYSTPKTEACLPFFPANEAAVKLHVPHVVSNDYWWNGLVFLNSQTHPVSCTIYASSRTGQITQSTTLSLPAGQKKALFFKNLFDPAEIPFIASLNIEAEAAISGLFLFGDREYNIVSGGLMKSR